MAVYSEVAAGNMGDAFNYIIFIVIISFYSYFYYGLYFVVRKGSGNNLGNML